MINFMGYNEKKLVQIINEWERRKWDNEMLATKEANKTKHIMTRAEAVVTFANIMSWNEQSAEKAIDFFIAAGMLKIKEEEKPKEAIVLFEQRASNGETIRLETWPEGLVLWVNGRIKYKYWEDANK